MRVVTQGHVNVYQSIRSVFPTLPFPKACIYEVPFSSSQKSDW